MKIFVTGGNGFIGSHLVEQILARGDAAVCLARAPEKMSGLASQGAAIVKGDITDRASLIAPMRGMDAVVHLAGVYEYGPRFLRHMRAVNVQGTRNVLETALELGIPRIIHTSTVAVFGNTRGLIVDESYRSKKEDMTSEYERTKWEAHYEVAVPLQAQGAPVIITQPGIVTGAGDTAPHMQIVDLYLRRFPLGFGAKSGGTWAHVDDVALGHLLALERGKPGGSYVLAGPALTNKQAMEDWQRLTGIPTPKIWMPGWVIAINQAALEWVERAGIHSLPFTAEGLASQVDYTFWASADKAKRELGWQPRPAHETFREMLEYELNQRGLSRGRS